MIDVKTLESLSSLGGTVITVVSFLWFLNKKNEDFNKIINNHLISSGKIIKDNSKALTKNSIALSELTIYIKQLNGKGKR